MPAGTTWHARTDTGRVRKVNEDWFLVPESVTFAARDTGQNLLFAVADGLGGHPGGDVASRMACGLLQEFYTRSIYPVRDPGSAVFLAEAMEDAFYEIDSRVRERAAESKAWQDMGTTLSALLLSGGKAICVHVGDCRIYRLRGKRLVQLTPDHNFVQEMIIAGDLNPAAAANHPLRHMLTQTVGTQEPLYDVFSGIEATRPADCFLLCSDGLHGMVSDTVILDALLAGSDASNTAIQLVDLALAKGGRDNVTAVVVHV